VTFHQFHLPSLAESRLGAPGLLGAFNQKLRFATLFPWLASRKAAALLQEWAPDILYGYEVHGVLAQRLVRRKLRRPLVARSGTIMHPYLHHRARFCGATRRRWPCRHRRPLRHDRRRHPG
jgi:hypothetical protein